MNVLSQDKQLIIRIASIDIGRCNFAQYIEDFEATKMKELEVRYKKLPKSQQRRVGGHMNDSIAKILEEITLCGKRVQTGVYDFTDEKNIEEKNEKSKDGKNIEKEGLTTEIRLNLLKHLHKFDELWRSCDIFVIEQQFFNTPTFVKKGTKRGPSSGANVNAIKMAEAVFMWFLDKYPFKVIEYFGSQYKTQIFGAPWKMSKSERKRWAIEKSFQIHTLRNDEDMINLYNLSEAAKRKQFKVRQNKNGIKNIESKEIKNELRIQQFKDDYSCKSDDAIELQDKIIRDKQKMDDFYGDAFLQAQAFKYRTMVACF